MNIGKEYIKKIILFASVFLISTISAEAANNSLLGIDVKQNAKDAYNVILRVEGNADVKKTISTSDTLTLILNSTIPTDTMEIIYDNTSDVNNVIVQRKNSDNTMVVFEGKNISNAKIYTKDVSTGLVNLITTATPFFGINKNMFSFSIGIMLLWFGIFYLFRIRKQQKLQKHLKNVNKHILKNAKVSDLTPSIAYKSQNAYVSAPKDFIINRYLEAEKIRKAC